MAILSKSKACLRIIGDELTPDEMDILLGCRATQKMVKGEPFTWNKKGDPRLARSGMWRLEANDQIPGDLDAQVSELLNQLPDDLEIWHGLSEKYKLDLHCGLFMESVVEGINLSAKSLLALGQKGIEVDFDLYGPDD